MVRRTDGCRSPGATGGVRATPRARSGRRRLRRPIQSGGLRVRGPQPAAACSATPDFLKLWTGQTISAFGTQVTILAVPIVAALTLKVSPFEFGLLGDDRVPAVHPPQPAGRRLGRSSPTSPDPHRRRPRRGRSASLSIPVAFALGVLTIWQLYVVVLRQRLPDRLLRRGLPELPALDRRSRPARRRQRQARADPGDVADGSGRAWPVC